MSAISVCTLLLVCWLGSFQVLTPEAKVDFVGHIFVGTISTRIVHHVHCVCRTSSNSIGNRSVSYDPFYLLCILN